MFIGIFVINKNSPEVKIKLKFKTEYQFDEFIRLNNHVSLISYYKK